MLTSPVNIAVFAAFTFCVGGILLSDAGFKPCDRERQRDMSRYGWQKRQNRGKKWQRVGKVGGKNGKVRVGCGRVHAVSLAVAST